ncbi:MAG: 23S rRNA (guanosine(2251)-2'-O)-methyltransferase RlmB [Ruminococcaceae bacterium]|nr:23S rRNA (guanosine(2251)-2'-O)-methyltransferase RlmB [Oscillospiraceae bacterium]
MSQNFSQKDELIIGRNPITEALRAGRELNQLFVARGERSGSIGKIIALAKDRGIPIKEVDVKKLDYMSGGGVHQGVAAFCAAHSYCSLEDIFAAAEQKGEAPFIIICDEIEDPHNLGAIIRTADAVGAHGVVVPKRRSAALTGIVAKASAGALEYVRVARVTNLAAALEEMKRRNVWLYCSDMDGQDYRQVDFSGAVGLVIGSEGRGVSRLIKETCDVTVSLPMKGKINSLNASVAAAVLMYAVAQGR